MIMGGLQDWIGVALAGAVFGIGMALMTGPRKAADGSKTSGRWPTVFATLCWDDSSQSSLHSVERLRIRRLCSYFCSRLAAHLRSPS